MSASQPHGRWMLTSGLATLLAGLGLAFSGLVLAPAEAKPADAPTNDHQISICHATGNGTYSNPNPTPSQILDVEHGHGLHVDDIIPPFPAGSQGATSWGAFPGRNWDAAGRAIYDACSPCKTGTHDELGNCVTPDPVPGVCAEGQVGVWPDCVTPDPVPEPGLIPPPPPPPPVPVPVPVPEVTTSVSDVVAQPASTRTVQVEGTQLLPTRASTEMVGATTLPRTGFDSLRLAQVGTILVLLGAAVVLLGATRRRSVLRVSSVPSTRHPVTRTGSLVVLVAVGASVLGRNRRGS